MQPKQSVMMHNSKENSTFYAEWNCEIAGWRSQVSNLTQL